MRNQLVSTGALNYLSRITRRRRCNVNLFQIEGAVFNYTCCERSENYQTFHELARRYSNLSFMLCTIISFALTVKTGAFLCAKNVGINIDDIGNRQTPKVISEYAWCISMH